MLKGWESVRGRVHPRRPGARGALRARRLEARDRAATRARRPRRAPAAVSPGAARRATALTAAAERSAACENGCGERRVDVAARTRRARSARRLQRRPVSSAASVSAPVGSTSSFASSASQRIASSTASSDTVTISSTRAEIVANVSSPSACVRTPSQIVRVTSSAGQLTIRPSRSDSCASAASSGSTPITRAPGQSALTAVATPEMSPPPPMQTTTVPTSGSACDDLEADGALAGDDPRVVERRDVLERAGVADLGGHALPLLARIRAADDLGAPGRGARDLHGAAFSGITIVAGTPSRAAAAATPCAWLPLESATTPRSIAPAASTRERCRRRGT